MNITSLTKRLAIALAVAGGLTLAALAQAQDIYYWDNFYPPWAPNSTLYSSWGNYTNGNTSAVNFTWLYTGNDTNSGLEVTSTIGGYGSGYADLNAGAGVIFANGYSALATNDTICTLKFTVNATPSMAASGSMFYTNYNWIGLVFILNLDSGIYDLTSGPHYSGWGNPGNPANYQWNGSNVVVTWDLSSQSKFLTYTEGGTNHFYGCNIGIDPAVIFNDPNGSSGFPPYDITFNSITFAAAPITPPNLSVSLVGTNVVIAWPDPATNTFTLLESQDPTFKTGWTPWGAGSPAWANGTNTLTLPPAGYNQPFHWFRLVNTNAP